MNPTITDWSADRRLDILVLGPMGETGKEASILRIKRALDALLHEPEMQALLARHDTRSHEVHVPEGQKEQEIVENVLRLLDTADLAVFDLTPKSGTGDRANVFYELALVHALGIPALLLIQAGQKVPFYASTSQQYRVPDFELATLMDALRQALREFLDLENRTTSFTNDRVSQFYGMPIVDISAANGIATGYYDNFISRLITDGGFISHRPDKIKQVLYVRPSSVHSTYEADMKLLKAGLENERLELEMKEMLEAIPSDNKGPIWFDHVEGIVIDIPRTIYPLRRSPRLLSLQLRNRKFPSPAAERSFRQRLHQIEETMLDRVVEAIWFQIRHDTRNVRSQILHFTTIAEAPALVKALLH